MLPSEVPRALENRSLETNIGVTGMGEFCVAKTIMFVQITIDLISESAGRVPLFLTSAS